MIEDDSIFMVEKLLDFMKKEAKKEPPERFPFHKFKTSWLFSSLVGGPFVELRSDQRNLNFAVKAIKKLGGQCRAIRGYNYWKLEKTETTPYHEATIENKNIVILDS